MQLTLVPTRREVFLHSLHFANSGIAHVCSSNDGNHACILQGDRDLGPGRSGVHYIICVQRPQKRYACFAKQQPGRARQKLLATTYKPFPRPYAWLCHAYRAFYQKWRHEPQLRSCICSMRSIIIVAKVWLSRWSCK